jgi:sugar/nucleoside kinase (ribokinase family)
VTHVVVVGDVMLDVVARMAGPFAAGSDTPACVRTRPGGSAANVAAWLSVAGVPVSLVARTGDDDAGRGAARGLARHGVDARIAVDPRRPTGTCVVLVHPGGERSMLPDAGANAALAPGDLPTELFRPGAHLHLTGYTVLRRGSRDAALRALALARAARMTISIDPSSAAPLATARAQRFLHWTGRPDLLLPNADEAAALTGEADPEAAAHALAAHAGEVVVTLGAGGALWTDGGDPAHAATAMAGPVSDTTGAGDAFAAGFLAGWLAGATPVAALERGSELAARAIAIAGAPGTP